MQHFIIDKNLCPLLGTYKQSSSIICILNAQIMKETYCSLTTRFIFLPSAPKSGLNDFCSLKFLKICSVLLPSLMAYMEESCDQTNS